MKTQTLRAIKRPVLHFFRIAEKDEFIITREGLVEARRGDAILTGVKGEIWPIQANKFLATYDILSNGQCRKKAIEVLAMQLDQPLQIAISERGNRLEGKRGDWLIQYAEVDFGIVE